MFQFRAILVSTFFLISCATNTTKNADPESKRSIASVWRADGELNQALPQSNSVLFSNPEPVFLSLVGDFARLHQANAGGNWTAEKRDDKKTGKDPNYWDLNGKLVHSNDPRRTIRAEIRARGMTSAQEGEATFPKLRVEIRDDEALKDTIFKGARNFRINTHVSTNSKKAYTEMGRLNNEKSPFREATVYEIGNALGLPSPLVRRARIKYTDSGTKQSFEKNALLIETEKEIAERFQARNSERFPSDDPRDQIDVRLAARFHLFNILIGNEDIGLKIKNEPSAGTEKYRPLFNTTVFELPNGQLFPIIYDFDLSSMVAGWPQLKYSLYNNVALNVHDGRIGRFLINLSSLRSRLSRQEYKQALSDFAAKEKHILSVIQNAIVDEEFKKTAMEHIQLFKVAVAELDQLPMLKKKDVRFFADEKLSKDLLSPDKVQGGHGTLRPGTAIKVLKKLDKVAKIAIIDHKYDLLDGTKTSGYISADDLVLDFDIPYEMQGYIDGRDMAY